MFTTAMSQLQDVVAETIDCITQPMIRTAVDVKRRSLVAL